MRCEGFSLPSGIATPGHVRRSGFDSRAGSIPPRKSPRMVKMPGKSVRAISREKSISPAPPYIGSPIGEIFERCAISIAARWKSGSSIANRSSLVAPLPVFLPVFVRFAVSSVLVFSPRPSCRKAGRFSFLFDCAARPACRGAYSKPVLPCRRVGSDLGQATS